MTKDLDLPHSADARLPSPCLARADWILAGKLDSLALIIMNRDTREVVERWQFDVHVEEPPAEGGAAGAPAGKENDG